MKTAVALFLIFSCAGAVAEERPKVDAKVTQILTAVISHVLFGEQNKSAREFYGTKGDTTVILLDGYDMQRRTVKWPRGFIPEIKGFTFVFGPQDDVQESATHDRRLAIRLDRLALAPPEKAGERIDPIVDRTPIRISIQNDGGTKNGAVMGGQTTWYAIVEKQGSWTVKYEGLLD
jgi:hypothetical protein